MNYNIFISCNSEDYRIGTEIYEFIVHSGFSVFLADQELRKLGNDDYGREIDSALEQATHLIVIASKIEYIEQETSPYVYYEWHSFSEEKKCGRKKGNLITILEDSIHIAELPYALRHCQSIKLSEYQKISNYIKVESVSSFDSTVSRNNKSSHQTYPSNRHSMVEVGQELAQLPPSKAQMVYKMCDCTYNMFDESGMSYNHIEIMHDIIQMLKKQ